MFVKTGDIEHESFLNVDRGWNAYGSWPSDVPNAKEYWLVWRYTHLGVPDPKVIPKFSEALKRVVRETRERNIPVAGVQLDIDSPTSTLAEYAAFLREIRKTLPAGYQLSITALLDWFRPGTAVGSVIDQVDEFVPQFYDLGNPRNGDDSAIAAKIDAARWGPVFNRFGKRFRIGIATFGRGTVMRASKEQNLGIIGFRDLSPIDVSANQAFDLVVTRNDAGERVLTYRATRPTRISYMNFSPGDTVRFILSSRDQVRTATMSAQAMGGHLAGVLYFRWPAHDESLAMQPDEVLEAAAAAPPKARENQIDTIDGRCASVYCADLYLESPTDSENEIQAIIRSSAELEYFLPSQRVPVRMTGPSRLELSIPAFGARGRIYLGRAVSASRVNFTVAAR